MEIIQMARALGKAIQESAEYQVLENAKKANDNDKELNDKIGEFNLVKMEIQTLMAQDNADQEKITAKNKELRELYDSIMENTNMMTFNKASQAMNTMMNHINNILIAAVNGEDPETCELEPQTGCSGSCGSCSGCH